MFNYFVFAALTSLLFINNVCCNCIWSINEDLPKKNPVYITRFRNNYELLYPNTSNVILKSGQTIYAVCTGRGNYISTEKGKDSVEITCESGVKVKVERAIRHIRDINCTKDATADLQNTGKKCAGKLGTELSIGYNTTYGWMKMYTLCYDYRINTPLYVKHIIYGQALDGAYVGNNRIKFNPSGLPSNISWPSIYRKSSQYETLTELLGQKKADIYLKSGNYFMDRGHLAPDADFLFNSMQMSTYFYANVVPQWQSINRGNWVRIENAVRRLAKYLKEDLTVMTGTYDVLQMSNGRRDISIYLAPHENVPVPKYIWKVVCTVDNKCIALIVNNDPFDSEKHNICEDICTSTKWSKTFKEDMSRGLITCCDVKEFNETVKYIPVKHVSGILKYPF